MKKKDVDKLIEILRFYYWHVQGNWPPTSTSKEEELKHINDLCVKVEKLRD